MVVSGDLVLKQTDAFVRSFIESVRRGSRQRTNVGKKGKELMHKILEDTAADFLKDLGKELVKHTAKAIISEVVRSQIDIWKQIRLKRKRREIDLVWREEDEARKERLERQKQEREEAAKNPAPKPDTKPAPADDDGEDEEEPVFVPPPVNEETPETPTPPEEEDGDEAGAPDEDKPGEDDETDGSV